MKHYPPTILVAESDPDERLLLRRALSEGRFSGNYRFVRSKEELLDYLKREGRYAYPAEAPPPSLLLLDLKVIRDDVPELVARLKEDPGTRRVPIIILTHPISEEESLRCYLAGANAIVEKSLGYEDFQMRIGAMLSFWFDVVTLPTPL